MGLRETINKNQGAAMGVAAGIVVLALAWIIYYMVGGSNGTATTNPKAFYTTDNGKNLFVDDDAPYKTAPFSKDGKVAYKALVWSCDGGKTKVVSALIKYSPAAAEVLRKATALQNFDDPNYQLVMSDGQGVLVRSPSLPDTDGNWLRSSDPKAAKLMNAPCPPGSDIVPMQAQ